MADFIVLRAAPIRALVPPAAHYRIQAAQAMVLAIAAVSRGDRLLALGLLDEAACHHTAAEALERLARGGAA